MTQQQLEMIVKSMAGKVSGGQGLLEFDFNQLTMYLMSDVSYDRMRIVTPVADYKQLKQEHIDAVMEANFHRALDARYGVSNGVLYAAYIHPLSSLNEAQVQSAVQQVANLASSFGTDYSSRVLSFGGSQ